MTFDQTLALTMDLKKIGLNTQALLTFMLEPTIDCINKYTTI
jgi:hypothetical protein